MSRTYIRGGGGTPFSELRKEGMALTSLSIESPKGGLRRDKEVTPYG